MTSGQVERLSVVVAGRWNRHSSEYPQTRNLHKARNRHEAAREALTRGEVTADVVTQLQFEQGVATDEVTQLLISSLDGFGVDLVGDGGFRQDSIFDVTRRIQGCLGFKPLTRIPGVNHFHRQLKAELPLLRKDPLLADDLAFALSLTSKPVVLSLPGPYSTARQTQNVDQIGLSRLSLAYADVFNQEAADLIRQGASFVRFEDPQILDHPEDMAVFKKAMDHLTKGIDQTRLALATWYGDIEDPDFFKLPFGIFCVDFVNGRESFQALRGFPENIGSRYS